MAKESCETENKKGVIEESLRFWPQQLRRSLPTVFGSLVILFSPIWHREARNRISSRKEKFLPLLAVDNGSGAAAADGRQPVAGLLLWRLILLIRQGHDG